MAYTSGDILARVIIPHSNGQAADAITNSWAFQTAGLGAPTSTERDNLEGDLIDFYVTTPASGVRAVGAYISGEYTRATSGCSIELYHIVVGALGSPFHIVNFTLPAASSLQPIPHEVSACLSFHADLTGVAEELPDTTRPRAQRRGRVYIGPLTTHALQNPGGDNTASRVHSNLRNDATLAAARLKAAAASTHPTWCVWSRHGVVLRPVVGGYMDDAFDTHRARGLKPTTRTTFS